MPRAMSTAKKFRPTRLEMEVLRELWKLGSGSIRQIQENLPEARRPEYTTIQTIVYRLEEKGAVSRGEKVANAHVFKPLVSPKSTLATLIDDLLNITGGSAAPLVSHLLESGRLSLRDLKELEKQAKKP